MRYLPWQDCLKEKPFTAVIDVRSPGEYAESHIPGAVNLPVLSNEERAEVGRLYCQVSRFEARRLGAAMVAANIGRHLQGWLARFPEHSRLLLYCWRGGQRSRAMAMILHAVGWDITVVSGGYKNYRNCVRGALDRLIPGMRFRILTGLTGSGKSKLLRRMKAAGDQVLDLEALGAHRGSLLGNEPGVSQPSQKQFESLLFDDLAQMDATRPVWVEGESKRLGRLRIPELLWQALKCAPVHELHVPAAARARFLLEDYPHFTADPEALREKLPALKEACGGKQIDQWCRHLSAGEWPALVSSLLECYYDPVYRRNQDYPPACREHEMEAVEPAEMDRVISELRGSAAEDAPLQ